MEKLTLLVSFLALLLSWLAFRKSRQRETEQSRVDLEQRRQELRLDYHSALERLNQLVMSILSDPSVKTLDTSHNLEETTMQLVDASYKIAEAATGLAECKKICLNGS